MNLNYTLMMYVCVIISVLDSIEFVERVKQNLTRIEWNYTFIKWNDDGDVRKIMNLYSIGLTVSSVHGDVLLITDTIRVYLDYADVKRRWTAMRAR